MKQNHYSTIVCDPPWPAYGGGKIRRGANKHYKLMTVADILALAPMVRGLVSPEGCHLYLWVTNNYLPDGLEVMKAYGFQYRTCITWGKDRMGLGQYFRGLTEHCLFGVYGHMPYRLTLDAEPKRAQGKTLILAPRREHSQKPDALMDMAELVSYPPRIELFARSRRMDWDCWGLEAP